jgi:hypothetical protein
LIEQKPNPERIGREEINLAEHPLGFLADRVQPGAKTLTFTSTHGTLQITGSELYGLPTAPDQEIILGLTQLTKIRNDFTSPTVGFHSHEVLSIVGWPTGGKYYARMKTSLRKWAGVTLYYRGSWWDNAKKTRVDASFHVLDEVVIREGGLSTFTWGKRFFQSCQAGNLKRLDLGVYFGLTSAISKQMYRFIDKHFYMNSTLNYDLNTFAFENVGLSRNYSPAKIREKLAPALEELEGIHFARHRYVRAGKGQWRIIFTQIGAGQGLLR